MACGSLFEFFFKFLLTSGLLLMDHARGAYGRCCEGQEIRVAALRSHWPPFWSWDGTNYPGGFNAASLRIIEEHTGYRARLVEIESPDAAGYVPAYTAMLRNGTADVAMGIRGPLDPRNMHYTVNPGLHNLGAENEFQRHEKCRVRTGCLVLVEQAQYLHTPF